MSDGNLPVQQPDQSPAVGGQMGGIELKASFMPLAFILFLFPAKAIIDGGAELSHGWGTKVYPIPAGRHTVRVWCPYFFVFKMGDITQTVDVGVGEVVALEWKCPWLVFLKGTWVPLGSRGLTQGDLQGGTPAVAPGGAPAIAQAHPGTPALTAAPDAGSFPAGWHPDPQGQAAMRYWDGTQWTDHVSDGQPAT